MAAPAPSRLSDESFEDEAAVAASSHGWMLAAPSWLVSMVTHLVLLVMLGLCYFNIEAQSREQVITALPQVDAEEVEIFELPDVVDPVIDDEKIETSPPVAASASTNSRNTPSRSVAVSSGRIASRSMNSLNFMC